MESLIFAPAYQIAQAIASRSVSVAEVITAHLAQIDRYNPELNAIVTLDRENALNLATAADLALEKAENWGKLHGVPITIKDTWSTQGLRTTSSYPPLSDYIPPQDAIAVARLRAAGAIIIGKTNTPQLAEDFQTNSPIFGRTNNPWNREYTPGGSTGGGAAAVAAGFSPLELGSDCGGSIRIPAHFCGVFGFKPTEQRVSCVGHIPELPGLPKTIRHLQTVGIMARSVEDLRLCLSVIEQPQSSPAERVSISAHQPSLPLSSCRFAWTERFADIPITTEIRGVMRQLSTRLAHLGCNIQQRSPPDIDFNQMWETYSTIFNFEFAFLPDQTPEPLQSYDCAIAKRNTFIDQIECFLENWDAWITPVAAIPAFTHRPMGVDLEVNRVSLPYWRVLNAYVIPFNLTGNPVVAIPICQSIEGLPIGIQIIGKKGSDLKLLAIAQQLSQLMGGFQRPPGY
ncbi:MAG: amidase [Microcoleaceae cyanobacterium]